MANFDARRKLAELIEKTTKVRDNSANSIGEEAFKVCVMVHIKINTNNLLYKKLKEILKDNNENVKSFFDLLMSQLSSKSSQVCRN